MSDIPRFTSCPPFRCWEPVPDRNRIVCGAVASWHTPAQAGAVPVFHCAIHRTPSDLLIRPPLTFRRISLSAEIVLAGVHASPPTARAEAWNALERAVVACDGLLNPLGVSDLIVRWDPPAGLKRGRPAGGKGVVAPVTD